MNDKVVNISFNVWANSDDEAVELKKAICGFIDYHGAQGRKVTAAKLTEAINNWQKNLFIRNQVNSYFK